MENLQLEFTMTDLENAECALREGDSGRQSNAGRARRHQVVSMDLVARIRTQMLKQGLIDNSRPLDGFATAADLAA